MKSIIYILKRFSFFFCKQRITEQSSALALWGETSDPSAARPSPDARRGIANAAVLRAAEPNPGWRGLEQGASGTRLSPTCRRTHRSAVRPLSQPVMPAQCVSVQAWPEQGAQAAVFRAAKSFIVGDLADRADPQAQNHARLQEPAGARRAAGAVPRRSHGDNGRGAESHCVKQRRAAAWLGRAVSAHRAVGATCSSRAHAQPATAARRTWP
jgi:hypothetical protein